MTGAHSTSGSAPTRSQRAIRAIIALPVIATTFVMHAMFGRRYRQLKMPRPDAYAVEVEDQLILETAVDRYASGRGILS